MNLLQFLFTITIPTKITQHQNFWYKWHGPYSGGKWATLHSLKPWLLLLALPFMWRRPTYQKRAQNCSRKGWAVGCWYRPQSNLLLQDAKVKIRITDQMTRQDRKHLKLLRVKGTREGRKITNGKKAAESLHIPDRMTNPVWPKCLHLHSQSDWQKSSQWSGVKS